MALRRASEACRVFAPTLRVGRGMLRPVWHSRQTQHAAPLRIAQRPCRRRTAGLALAHRLLSLALILLAGLLLAQPGLAHTRVELDSYTLVVGWAAEPVIVGERNALVVEVSQGDLPVTGLEGSLQVSIRYGGRSMTGNLSPTGTPGHYQVPLFPTVRGQYVLHFSGTIQDTPVDVAVEPEEVLSARVLQFPEVEPDVRELQGQLSQMGSRLQNATLLAAAGLAVGMIGLVTALLALRRRPQQGGRREA